MIWLGVVLGMWVAINFAVAWFSVRPYRLPIYLTPESLETPAEDLWIPSTDGLHLRGWWIPGERQDLAVALFHGYFMNRSELLPEAFHLARRGVPCLIVDLRAHGNSQGKRCTLGLKEAEDVRTCLELVRSRLPQAKIVAIGSSMGSAAIALAARDDALPLDGMVLDSCYGRQNRAILGWWRFVGGKPLSLFLSLTVLFGRILTGVASWKVDIARALQDQKVPVLFFHGDRDDLAEPEEARRNFEAVAGEKEIVWFEGCGHSEGRWLHVARYRRALDRFLDRIAPTGTL